MISNWRGVVAAVSLVALIVILDTAWEPSSTSQYAASSRPVVARAGMTEPLASPSTATATPTASPLVFGTSFAESGLATPSPGVYCKQPVTSSVQISSSALSPASTADILCLVEAATTLRVVPDGLSPPLDTANWDDVIPGEDACVADIPDLEVPACAFGDPGGSRSVILYGDSTAAMWLPAFDAIGKRAHWKVTLLAKTECTAAYISTFVSSKQRLYTECDLWHDYAIARINAAHPDLVVVTSLTGDGGIDATPISRPDWQAALIKTLKLITIPDSRKVVLSSGPVPIIGDPPDHFTGPDCLSAHLGNVQACSATRDVAIGWTFQPEERVAAAEVGAHYVDVDPWLCADDVCPAIIGKMDVYAHDGRLSTTYATFVSGALQSELEPIMGAR